MNKALLNLWKKYSKDFYLIFPLLALAFYSWRFLPTWILQDQAFMYFDPRTINTYLSSMWKLITTAQVAGILLSTFIPKLIGVNMSLYMWVQLISMLFIGTLFYFVIRIITKNRFIASSAALIYVINYFGNYNMYMIDYSAHFLERASINVVLLLLSFLFLHLFLEKTKLKYYVISTVLYFLGMLFSHFSILFTAPYFFYPLFWYFFNKKSILKGLTLGMVYVLISGFFVYLQSIGSEPFLKDHVSFLQFLLNPQKYRYPEGVLMQLVYWSQYPSVFKAMSLDLSPISLFDYETAAPLKPLILITYIICSLLAYKILDNKRPLLLTTILATLSIFLLNIYLGRYDPFYTAGTSRYLYFPTYLLAIFWSLFLWVLFKNKSFILKITSIIILTGYYYINTTLLSVHYARFYSSAKSQKAIFNHIIDSRDKLKPNTLVIAPYPDMGTYEAPFFTTYLGKGEVRYMSEFLVISNWPEVASSSSHVIRFKYDDRCACVLEEKIK